MQIQVEGSHVFIKFFLCLLKGHEDASLVVIDRTVDQKINPQKGFASAGASTE